MSNIDKQANLRNAARHGRIDDVKRYLNDDTIDVNGKNGSHYDWTALHYACDYGHRDIAELLLDHGADIDARSSSNSTPLILTCSGDHASSSITKLLLDRGCAVNAGSYFDWTALHYACKYGHRDIAELLLDHGADIDARSRHSNTPLILTCYHGHTSSSITKLLLDRGCAVNATDATFGETALHTACKNGYTECVKELLAHGADTTIKSKYGKNPLDIAREKKHQPVIDILMEHKNNKKSPEQQIIGDSIQDIKNVIKSEMNTTLKAEVPAELVVASAFEERLSSKVEAIIDRRFEELLRRDMTSSSKQQESQELMQQTVKTLTSDFESNIEELRNDILKAGTNQENKQMMSQSSFETLMSQLTTSNAEVTKCVSNLSTIVEHLSSKVSAIEGHQETTMKEQMKRSLQQTLTSEDHSTVSNLSGADTLNVERKKDVECFEEDSLSVLKSIQAELHQSLSICQTMLS